MRDLNHNIKSKIENLEDTFYKLEMSCNSRLSDCEELLKTRINEDYVHRYGRVIEE